MQGSKTRAFIAIDIPLNIRSKIAEISKALDSSGIKTVGPEQLHITMFFLGYVDAEQLEAVKGAISRIRARSFAVDLNGIGTFDAGHPRVVKLSGVVITKMDGSAKGGGALSATAASGTAVMFIGTGEKLNNIEPFDAEKYIGSLLGIPNIGALISSVQEAVKEAQIKPEDANMNELNFDSFYMQLKAMSKLGPLKNVFGMLGAPDVSKDMLAQSEGKLKKYEVIIASMTKSERTNERLLREQGRIKRIASGSGTSETDVNALIADFDKMKKVFGMLKGDRGLRRRFAGFA